MFDAEILWFFTHSRIFSCEMWPCRLTVYIHKHTTTEVFPRIMTLHWSVTSLVTTHQSVTVMSQKYFWDFLVNND